MDAFDKWQNEHYKHCQKVFDRYLTDTNTSIAPWYIIDAKDRNFVELQVLEIMVNNIEVALQNSTHSAPLLPNIFPLEKMPKLSEIELTDKVLYSDHILFFLSQHLPDVSGRAEASPEEAGRTA